MCPMTSRPAAVGSGLPAGATLAVSQLLRATGRGPARRATLAAGRKAEPSAVILDSRTLRATPESGERGGYDGAGRNQGCSQLHMAVDTLGHFLALHVTPANADDRAQVEHLAKAVQAATDDSVEIAFVGQGCTGGKPGTAARVEGESIPEIFPSTAVHRGLEASAR